MKEWKTQQGTQPERPQEMDKTSSPTTVYLRRNIVQVQGGGEETESPEAVNWQYEEQEITIEEFENMMLMRSIVAENTSKIVKSVTDFQKDEVIDEYTLQLVEEGVL